MPGFRPITLRSTLFCNMKFWYKKIILFLYIKDETSRTEIVDERKQDKRLFKYEQAWNYYALLHRGIISEDSVKKRHAPVTQEIGPKYKFLRSIQNNPKSVEIQDLETGEITTYSSIYKASRAIDHSTKPIMGNNCKVWKKKYEIKITDVQ